MGIIGIRGITVTIMTTGSFLQALGLPEDASPETVERRFVELVKARIQAVSSTYDESAVEREVQAVRQFHNLFFQHVLRWSSAQVQAHKNQGDIPEAARLKSSSRALVEDLQNNIIEFAICYMQINRFMTLLRDEIRREHIRVGAHAALKIKANADTGEMIHRQNKEKDKLVAGNRRLKEARGLLEQIERDMANIRADFLALTGGKDHDDAALRSLVAALRTSNFSRARQVIREMTEAKKRFGVAGKTAEELHSRLEKRGAALIETIAANAQLLEGPDRKLFLRVDETSRVYNAQVRDLHKIKAFMAKYHLPYMDYKIETLVHLKDKLLVTGSLEHLLALYIRLMTMLATPLTNMKDLRQVENDLYLHTKYLLESYFPEIPKILARACQTVEEFRTGRNEYEDLEKIELQEVEGEPVPGAG